MTGFGTASAPVPGGRITAEARSVNHRFLEVRVSLPREHARMEGEVRDLIRNVANRGRVEISVSRTPAPERRRLRVEIRDDVVRAYVRALRRLQREMKLAGELGVATVGAVPELIRVVEVPTDVQREIRSVARVVRQALRALARDRSREGSHLAADMRARARALGVLLHHLDRAVPRAVAELRDRGAHRIQRLAGSAGVDPQRLAQEAAIIAERADVTEELVRLRSHLPVLRNLLGASGAVGKRIEFVLQEMQREINTIGAKLGDPAIAGYVLDAKAQIEKLREQVQNVE